MSGMKDSGAPLAQLARTFGLDAKRLLENGWQNVLHPEDLPRAIEKWTEALRTGNPYEVELPRRLGACSRCTATLYGGTEARPTAAER